LGSTKPEAYYMDAAGRMGHSRGMLVEEMPTKKLQNASLQVHVVENHPDTLKYLAMFVEQLGHVTHQRAFDAGCGSPVEKAAV
jgi:hypothetical protein